MSNSASVRAILSAQDKNFSSTIKSALGSVKNLASEVGGFKFGVFAGIGQQAFQTVKNSVVGLIGEIDSSNASWKTFTKNMQMVGKSEKEIAGVKKELQDFAQKTVYSSSDMATTFAQLEAVGVKNTTNLVKGFGGLAAAAENPQQAMKTLSTQATQMAAKPSVAWADFKLMLEQSPAGIAAIAKEMGMTTAQLVSNVQDGKIETDKFFDAIAKVGTNKAFSEMATEAKTVGQAMDGLKETIGNKLTPAFEVLNKKGISIINKLADKFADIDASSIADKVSNMVDNVGKYLTALKEAFSGVGSEVWGALSEIAKAVFGMNGAFGSTESVDGFKDTMKSVADLIKSIAGFAKDHAKEIGTLIRWLPAIVVGIKGFKVAKAVAGGVTAFASGVGNLLGKVKGKGTELDSVSDGMSKAGSASVESSGKMLNSAKSFALMGAAVLLIAAGFALLAFSAISLANAGGGAIAVMAGLVIALAALGVGMAFLLKMLVPMSAQLMPVATAMLLMGAAVVLVAAGFLLLATASVMLANAGGLAIGVMVGMIAAIALMAIGAAYLAPMLAVGATGLIAFGGALALCGVGAVLAATSLVILSSALPVLVQYGLQGAVAILALGGALAVFAVGAGLAGAAALILGAGLVVATVGIVVAAAAAVLLAAGFVLLGAGGVVGAAGVILLAAALVSSAAVIPSLTATTLLLVAAFTLLSALAVVMSATLLLVSVAMLAMSVGSLAAFASVTLFGGAMIVAAAGSLIMAAALKGISSQMKSIAKNAKTAQSSLKTMQSSVDAVKSGLEALGSKAKSAMQKLTSAFDDTASKAKSSGQKVGKAFTDGLKNGLNEAPSAAATISNTVSIALMSGRSGAYTAGSFISKGFAQGMLSCLGVVQNAAAKLAAAADKAVRAKAKIHSPSKVADKLGTYWGEGYVGGLASMVKDAYRMAEEFVAIPTVATPNLAAAYSGEMSADYDYYRNSEYIIEVPLTVDGKEFARATANYTQSELNRREQRENRKLGKV